MGPERLSNLFKLTQLRRSMVKLSTPKSMVFSLNSATKNHSAASSGWEVELCEVVVRRILLSFFHNYLGAESQRESEQVLEDLTSKATSPEEPRAAGHCCRWHIFLVQLSHPPLTTLSEVPFVIIKTGSGLWLWKGLEPPRAGSCPRYAGTSTGFLPRYKLRETRPGRANYRWGPLRSGCSLLLSEILRFPAPFKLKGNPVSHMVRHKPAGHKSESWERTKEGAGIGERRQHPYSGSPACGLDGLWFAVLLCHNFTQTLDFSVPQFLFSDEWRVSMGD